MGGGFGSKLEVYPEEALALALARKVGRPIKWTEERSEGYLATLHGRDLIQEMELAATPDGILKAVRCKVLASMGAYYGLVSAGIQMLGAWLYAGVYDPEGYDFEYTNVFTNNTLTDAYRGAGRPEATYAIERAMDALARELKMDPAELRKKNFIKTENFPNYTIVSGLTVDSADYSGTFDMLLEKLDYKKFRAEQAAQRQAGGTKMIGVGFSTWLEMCGLAPSRVLARAQVHRRRVGRGDDRVHAHRHGARAHRRVAPRPGARDHVLADRGRPARRGRQRRRGACTATPR